MAQAKPIRVARGTAAFLILLLAIPNITAAAISRPDAMLYGRVSLNGAPVPGAVVSARIGEAVLDEHTVGSSATSPDFYGLSIPMSQAVSGENLGASMPSEGSLAQLFLGDRMIGEIELRSGSFIRRDVSGGEALCTGGSNDGNACVLDEDCPGGLCVAARALCDGGSDDGRACECIGGMCSDAVSCSTDAAMGTCNAGSLSGECCDLSLNCNGGSCSGSQQLCASGPNKGQPCINDGHCMGQPCVSTGLVCIGGSAAGFSCVDGAECPGGSCGIRQPTATPTPSSTPTPTRTPIRTTPAPSASPTLTQTPDRPSCPGDCDGSNTVSISELIRLVNVALGQASIDVCPAGDINQDGRITINELIAAVNSSLQGCP